MAAVSDEALVERLRGLLTEIDMEKTSEKMVRKMLEKEFGVDLSEKKSLIREQITKLLAEIQEDDDDGDGDEGDDDYEGEEEEEEQPAPQQKVGKKRKKSGPPPVLSEEMQEFLGCESMPRTEITKQLWVYIKENDLQDPANKRNILLDDKLKTLFTSPLTMFTMAKQLSAHIQSASKQRKRTEEEGNNEEMHDDQEDSKKGLKKEEGEEMVGKVEEGTGDEEGEEKPARRSRAKSKPAASKGEGKKRGGGGGFMKPIKVTTELAEFLGTEEITRPNLTKFMWNYFKSNELQDPADRRHILCDEKLKALMNVDRFQAFSFMKFLKHHVVS